MDFCRLLARDGTPIVSRNAGDDYVLTREQSCNYVSLTVSRTAGVKPRRRQRYRYPRKIRIGDAWVLVRSFEEERSTLLRYRGELEEKVSESKLPSQRAAAKQRVVYTTKRLAEVSAERKRMIRRTDKELIILAALSWL